MNGVKFLSWFDDDFWVFTFILPFFVLLLYFLFSVLKISYKEFSMIDEANFSMRFGNSTHSHTYTDITTEFIKYER